MTLTITLDTGVLSGNLMLEIAVRTIVYSFIFMINIFIIYMRELSNYSVHLQAEIIYTFSKSINNS